MRHVIYGRQYLEDFQHNYQIPAIYTDYHRMLRYEDLDLVVISTQAPQHHPITLAAAQHGIHIFCEKPTALSLQEADEMVEACEEAGIRFSINHQKRASNYNSYVKQLLSSKEIGKLVLIHAYDKGGRTAGNAMMEMGTHLFDWVRCFAGDVNWASAHLNTGMDEAVVEDIKHSQEVNAWDRDAGLVVGESILLLWFYKWIACGLPFFGSATG
ncbi:TPA: Gfo/Idh/MocA family oxidoreductase [Candidatus Poribacteria bacterium]|nr:Gfo/Idh/MocA family oxidoreductase [Candidatus Poribacteria bacterium]